MRQLILFSLLAAAMASAQMAPAEKPAETPGQTPAAPKSADITPDTPVITLNGLCPEKPTGTDPKSPDCKTVVTKAEFEKLASTLAPNMPGSAKQQLAGDYARMLVLSEEAKKRGVDKTEKFENIMRFMRLRVLAQELMGTIQEKSKPKDAEVEKYYQDNKGKYEELALKRLFIPRNRPEPADKKTPAPKPPTDEELQAQGEKALARLKAGESFDKVQKDIYTAAGFKTPPPPTSIPNWRRDVVPAAQQSLFDLNKGDYSKVSVEPAGAYVYQLEEKKTIPLEQTKPEIEQALTSEHMRKQMESITSSIKPEVNEAYFRAMSEGERPPQAMMPAPQEPQASGPATKRPMPTRPATTKATPAKSATTTTPKK